MLPAGALAGEGPLAALTVQSTAVTGNAVVATAIEQFDVQLPETLVWGFDDGWHEAEYTPALGLWHWTSERAALRVYGATTDVRVTLGFESPRRYFDAADRPCARARVARRSAARRWRHRSRGRSTCHSRTCDPAMA